MANSSGMENAAALKLQVETLKRGKSPEQKRAIDFFFDLGSKGCGCLSRNSTMSISEYINLVQSKVNKLDTKTMALSKIGLDESEVKEIEPICLSSFVYDDDVYVKAENDIVVSSQYSISWIFFSATQIYTYKYIFDTTSDNTWEITNDFFYTDITCFTTVRAVKEKIDLEIKGCVLSSLFSGDNYVKHNYVVDTLEIIVPGTTYKFGMRNSEKFEPSVQAAKAMLREKKYNK